MPYNGSGTFNRLYSWVVDAANSINISSSRTDAEMNGFAAGLTNCITRDGQSPPSANTPWGGLKITNLGAATTSTDALNMATGDARYLLASAANLSLTGTLTAAGLITGSSGFSGTTLSLSGAATVNGFLVSGSGLTVDSTIAVGFSHSHAGQVAYHLYNQGGVTEWLMYQPVHAADDDFHISALAAGVITDRLRINATTGAVSVPGALSANSLALSNALPVAAGGTGVTTSTGSGSVVLSSGPTFTGIPAAPTASSGTATTQLATTAFVDGLRDVPSNAQTVNYTLALTDRGKGVDFNGTSLTCTIPANASVAFPVGSVVVITNLNSTSLSIAITTDTLTLSGTTTTGTRTLGQNGEARLRKVTTTSWLIAGTNLS